ncbi:hypothetical protein BZG36_03613 [Bifiguratus adelaidae]|uniref:Uncharacterized protein n=1 Tax=Bifiguratus adelaidae TaxID=1938954 RepID=A0A261Y086_9FUNG|nr:hypothetical protein BZG36_03613 [Bifiguratus adelaidae]
MHPLVRQVQRLTTLDVFIPLCLVQFVLTSLLSWLPSGSLYALIRCASSVHLALLQALVMAFGASFDNKVPSVLRMLPRHVRPYTILVPFAGGAVSLLASLLVLVSGRTLLTRLVFGLEAPIQWVVKMIVLEEAARGIWGWLFAIGRDKRQLQGLGKKTL